MIALGWLYWLAYQLASIVLMPVGWLVIGIAAACRAWEQRPSVYPYADGRIRWQWVWPVPTIWSNEEDGIAGNADPTPWTAFKWSALRNSANNLRCAPGAYFVCDSTQLKFKDYPWGYVATQGWRQCVNYKGFRFGWLIPRTASTGSPAWPVISKQ